MCIRDSVYVVFFFFGFITIKRKYPPSQKTPTILLHGYGVNKLCFAYLYLRLKSAGEMCIRDRIDTTMKEFGRIDILVNNAGVMDDFSPVAEITDEMWEEVLAINLTAPFRLCKQTIPIMLEQNGGVIINMSSIAGLYSTCLLYTSRCV